MKNCYKTINFANLNHNISFLKKIAPQSKFCAVVKSDAYGHGIKNICPAIQNKVDYFAVSNNDEAILTRELCPTTPCLILGPLSTQNLSDAISQNSTFSIQNASELSQLNRYAKMLGKIAYYHLQIDTGMHRYGLATDSHNFYELARRFSYAKMVGIYSHLGSGKTPKCRRTSQQIADFEQSCSAFPADIIRHICNTQNLFSHPAQAADMVRCGLGIYGYGHEYLKPIMNIYAKIIAIQEVQKGDYVGYGLHYRTKQNMRVATLSIGYAQGLPRTWAKNGFVLINNKKAQIIADICMEATIVEITHLPAKIGDYAVILSNLPALSATKISTSCGTIPYEILTNFKNIEIK